MGLVMQLFRDDSIRNDQRVYYGSGNQKRRESGDLHGYWRFFRGILSVLCGPCLF